MGRLRNRTEQCWFAYSNWEHLFWPTWHEAAGIRCAGVGFLMENHMSFWYYQLLELDVSTFADCWLLIAEGSLGDFRLRSVLSGHQQQSAWLQPLWNPVQFLTHCGFRGYIPSWLAHDFVHECSLGEHKSVLLRLLSSQIKHDLLIWENKITFKCWFSSFGHLILHLRALGVPPVRLGEHSTFQIIKSCLSQENKSASKYLCWLHLHTNSEFLVWTTRASEMIVCIKSLEI